MALVNQELQELSLFSDVSRTELAHVAQQLTRLSVRAGRVLVREGARGDEFMIILEGEAEVSRDGRTIAMIGRGDLVGEMALLHESGRGKRNATVTAVTDLVLYVGTPSEFRQMIDAAPSVAEKIHRTADSRIRAAA